MTRAPYQPVMTETQLAFFQALTAPFPEEALSEKPAPGKSGKTLTWLDKRVIENRLDSVCTPLGWTVEYRPTNRGFTARMGILCPTHDGEWVWIYKEDGAGYEEMDGVDNDEKSGYTNALRRVAQDSWGIGRYLYRKGLPSFADTNARARPELPPYVSPDAAIATAPAQPPPAPEPAPRGRFDDPPLSPASQPSPPSGVNPDRIVEVTPVPATPPPAQPPTNGIDPKLLQIPQAGRPMFGWVKSLSDFYQTEFKNIVVVEAERLGGSRFMNQWTQEIVDKVAKGLIQHIRTLDVYGGEFEDMLQDEVSGNAPALPDRRGTGSAPPAPATGSSASATPPAQSSPTLGVDAINDARSRAAAAVTAYVTEVHGIEKPAPAVLKRFVAEMSPDCFNSAGQRGEVMVSVGACTDVVWLDNLVSLAAAEVERFRQERDAKSASAPPDNDIPF